MHDKKVCTRLYLLLGIFVQVGKSLRAPLDDDMCTQQYNNTISVQRALQEIEGIP